MILNTGIYARNLVNGVNGNIIGVAANLGPLQDNGGPTKTHALLPGSPAIGAGNTDVCKFTPVNNRDQRNVTRLSDGKCDIGAYEVAGILVHLPIVIKP